MVQIEPLVSLAFGIYAAPGVYALLLGSGTSRSAGIPTGEEIVLDLIGKITVLEEEEVAPEQLRAWYEAKFQRKPNYSELLAMLANTSSERTKLLQRYFEPTVEEREQGLKIPTPAHRAIAELVANDYIKVIITTNFDRLLETALTDQGLAPSVLSNENAVRGALPLAHSDCTVLKVNGDYLDVVLQNNVEKTVL